MTGPDEPEEASAPPEAELGSTAAPAAAASSQGGGRLATAKRWWHVPRFLRNGLVTGLLILAAAYVVAYVWPEAEKYVKNIEHVNFFLLVVGFVLEVLSLFAFAKLTVVVMPEGALTVLKAWRINLVSLAFGHVIPAGTAGGTGMSIKLMTSEGLNPTDVGFGTATMGIGSAVLLNAMLWLALIISIPLNGFRPVYVYVALASLIVLAFFAALIAGFAQGDGWAVRVLRWLSTRVHFIPQEKLEHVVSQIAERIKDFWGDADLVRRGVIWAALNWLLDAGCLYVALFAFHGHLNPIDLFVAYGVGNVVAVLPFTPGGLGTVEFATILMLKAFGVAPAEAAAAVLAWRLFNFWLPIPVGGACYLSIRVQRGASLREMAKQPRHVHPGGTDPGPAVPPMG